MILGTGVKISIAGLRSIRPSSQIVSLCLNGLAQAHYLTMLGDANNRYDGSNMKKRRLLRHLVRENEQ